MVHGWNFCQHCHQQIAFFFYEKYHHLQSAQKDFSLQFFIFLQFSIININFHCIREVLQN